MCEYCSDAFIDLTVSDNSPEPLDENRKRGLFGELVWLSLHVNEHGHLAVYADMGNGSKTILTKKIRFCPMCGAEIPRITPTDRHKRGRPRG